MIRKGFLSAAVVSAIDDTTTPEAGPANADLLSRLMEELHAERPPLDRR